MENKSQQAFEKGNGKVYSNPSDGHYHKQTNCKWMLPVVYDEIEVEESSRLSQTPCKHCVS